MFAKSITVTGNATQPSHLARGGSKVMRRKPWTVTTQSVFADGGFGRQLLDATFDKGNGQPISYRLITQSPWATGLAITTSGHIIKVREPKPGRGLATGNFFGWELPAGALKSSEGQTPEALFAKALENETGYRAGRIVRLGPDEPFLMASRTSPTTVQTFIALDCQQVSAPKQKSEGEEIEYELVTLQEWVDECLTQPSVNEWSAVLATVFGLLHLGWKFQPPK